MFTEKNTLVISTVGLFLLGLGACNLTSSDAGSGGASATDGGATSSMGGTGTTDTGGLPSGNTGGSAIGTTTGGTGDTGAGGALTASGGSLGVGGSSSLAGSGSPGGASTLGGASNSGGAGGATAAGGSGNSGGSGGATTVANGPCDIYAADGNPCGAAHSTVRALYAAYTGPLYQVKKADGTTKDISVVSAGGVAKSADQDAFCGTAACTISIIYDQSGHKNHLTPTPAGGGQVHTADKPANASGLPITLNGAKVYGELNDPGVGYRYSIPKGTTPTTATGDDAETEYAVFAGDYYNEQCCFDYGNMETNIHDNGEGTMEAVYFGNCVGWGRGGGNGPWVMGDLENGLWAGNTNQYTANPSLNYKYITAMVKGDKKGSNHWAIKAGNAQTGALTKYFDGVRPSSRYNPMRKDGSIGLGTGGDNTNGGKGKFYEGVMTIGFSSDTADSAVQANIVAAGFGK